MNISEGSLWDIQRGVSKPLNVIAHDATQTLTDTVSVRIAHAAGGDELLNEYIRRFAVGYSE